MQRRYVAAGVAGVLVVVGILWFAFGRADRVDPADVQSYADPVVESLLTAMNQDDYAAFAAYLTPEMQEAMPEAVFQESNGLIQDRIGAYESKEFVGAERRDRLTAADYRAAFSDEPGEVRVRVVFEEVGGRMQVAGFWLDSPKLRE